MSAIESGKRFRRKIKTSETTNSAALEASETTLKDVSIYEGFIDGVIELDSSKQKIDNQDIKKQKTEKHLKTPIINNLIIL